MSSDVRVAVVTGANKGVGFGIVRGLCKQFKGDVYLTARNEQLGLEAVEILKKEGLNPKFHQLDLTKLDSIQRLKAFLQSNYGGLDVLVNNAGIAYKEASTAPFVEQVEVTVRTNFTGTLDVCEALLPLLRPHARVVNVSSMLSLKFLSKCSEELRIKLTGPDLTIAELKGLINQFVELTKTDSHSEKGWPSNSYGVSKIGVTVMSIIQQRVLDNDPRADIVVNAVCPGYVDTDMSSHKGTKTIDEGADTPLYAALLPPYTTTPKGTLISDRIVHIWE